MNLLGIMNVLRDTHVKFFVFFFLFAFDFEKKLRTNFSPFRSELFLKEKERFFLVDGREARCYTQEKKISLHEKWKIFVCSFFTNTLKLQK